MRRALVRAALTGLGVMLPVAPGTSQPPIAGRVLDAAGHPAAGAALTLRWRVHPELPGLVGISLGDHGVAASQHRAGDDGRFVIRPPHGGPFLVVAEAQGQRSAQQFPVMAGDALELRLEPAFDIGGVLLGADNQPVAAAEVMLRPHHATWSRLASYRFPEPRATATTDDHGRFTLPFELGYLRQPHWGILMSVAVPRGEWQTWMNDIVRSVPSARELVVPLRAGRVRGRLVDEHDQPVAGGVVWDPGVKASAVRCQPDGTYEIPAWAWKDLVAWAPGRAPVVMEPDRQTPGGAVTRLERGWRVRATLLDAGGQPLAGARVLWAVPRRGDAPIEWVRAAGPGGEVAFDGAPGGRPLLGFVEADGVFAQFCCGVFGADTDLGEWRVGGGRTVRGQVLDDRRAPLPHARVALWTGPPSPERSPRITYTDLGGRFLFAAVPAGAGIVSVDAAAHGWATADVRADDLDPQLTLTTAGDPHLGGVVIDLDDQPVAGAWVTIVSQDFDERDLPGPAPGTRTFCTLTDAEGRFHFGGLRQPGEWKVLCNYFRDGAFCGGGGDAQTGDDEAVVVTHELSR